MSHPNDTTLHDWAAGDLSDAERADLESHVDGCPACQTRLSAAARQEEMFEVVARSSRPAARSWRTWVVAGAAMAAAVTLIARLSATTPAPQVGFDASVDCTVAESVEGCESSARSRGLMLPGEIPIYESVGTCMDCGREG